LTRTPTATAEEVTTTSLDAAATDAAEARATSAQPPLQQQQQQQQPSRGGSPDLSVALLTSSTEGGSGAADLPAGQSAGGNPDPGEQPMLDPRKLGVLVQLQQRWAGHQLRYHIANAAQGLGSSISSARSLVSPFHPFGEQYYITEAGVVAPTELPPDMPLSNASQAFSVANPGIINFHRCALYCCMSFAGGWVKGPVGELQVLHGL